MTTTIIAILALAVVALTAVVAVMVRLFWRKNSELKQKNEAIVTEMQRNQNIIERAVKLGISRAALLCLALIACLLPQKAGATHVDDTWAYSVELNGSNTVAIKVPVYDEDGADCWVADGKLKMKVDGVETVLFRWQSETDIDNDHDYLDCKFQTWADGFLTITQGNSSSHFVLYSTDNEQTRKIYANSDGETYDVSAVWRVPYNLRGKTITFIWDVTRDGNSRSKEGVSGLGQKELAIPASVSTVYPQVTEASLSFSEVGMLEIPWFIATDKLKKIWAEYTGVNGSVGNKELEANMNSGYVTLDATVPYKNFHILANYVDPDGDPINGVSSTTQDLKMLHVPIGFKATPLGDRQGQVELTWSIEYPEEEDLFSVDNFEIQRSITGEEEDFVTIGATPYTSKTKDRTYSYTDNTLLNAISEAQLTGGGTLEHLTYRVRRTATQTWGWQGNPAAATTNCLMDDLHLLRVASYSAAWENEEAFTVRVTWDYADEYNAVWDDRADLKIRVIQTNLEGEAVDTTETVLSKQERDQQYKILTLSRTCVNYNIEVYTDRGTSALRLYNDITPYYLPIRTEADWDNFRYLVKDAEGKKDINARLYADITTGIGIAWDTRYPYRGTFDGNGHTLTFNLNSSDTFVAPFRYVSTAVFKNLNVAGTTTSSGQYTAGLIGSVVTGGSTLVENCRISPLLNNSISGDATMGGIVGTVSSGSELILRNTLFDGQLEGSNCHSNGGFIGWSSVAVQIENCIFRPSGLGTKFDNCATWVRGTAPVLKNSFSATYYSRKDVIINNVRYNVIYNSTDWNEFVKLITYSKDLDVNAILASDIYVSQMAAPYTGSTTGAWRGILDGNGHTIRLEITGTGNSHAYNSPFSMGAGYTIRNLHVTGNIKSAAVNSSGLVGLSQALSGTTNTITNCHISVNITGDKNYLAGLIGSGGSVNTNITNCLFDGSLTTTSTGESYASAFVYGTSSATNVIKNCLENGTYTGFRHTGFSYYNTTAYANNIPSTNNWSYHNWGEMSGNVVGTRSPEALVELLGKTDWHVLGDKVVPVMHTQDVLGNIPEDILSYFGDAWEEKDGKVVPKQRTFIDPASYDQMETMEINGKSYYVLRTTANWNSFIELVAAAKGETAVNAIMMKDISITERVGTTQDAPYYGTFNGNGHTLTANLASNLGLNAFAPFTFVKGATFTNLHVAGTVKGSATYTSGFIGRVLETTTTTVRNCWVSADVEANSLVIAGFIGYAGKSALYMLNNRFDGSLTGTRKSSSYVAGAIVGDCASHSDWTFRKHYENGTYNTPGGTHGMCFDEKGQAYAGAPSGNNNYSAHDWTSMGLAGYRNVTEEEIARKLQWNLVGGKAIPPMDQIADSNVPTFYHAGTGTIDKTLMTATRQSSVILTWTTDGKPIDYFTVYRRTGVLANWEIVETYIDKNSYEDTTVSPLVDYQYKVVATSDCEGLHTSETDIAKGSCKHTGMLEGYVRFNDGTGIPNLTLSIVREDTNTEETTTVTDESGHYVCEDLSYHDRQSISYKVVPVTEGGRMDLDPTSRIATFDDKSNYSSLNELTVTNGLLFNAYVMYDGTSIPVKGVRFRVNGQLMHNNRGGYVETDFDGNASFMLLGGVNNVIQAEMDGHTFTGGGYYKSKDGVVLTDKVGQTYFYDATLVKVTGRVVGGNDQGLLPLDNNLSRNNLGSNLRMVLTLEGDNTSWLVYDNLNPTLSKRTLTFDHPAGKGHQTQADVERKRMVVRPDSVTGEYVLKLPPVRWKVTQVYCDGYPTLFQDGMVSEVIDLTDCLTPKDSTYVGTFTDVDNRTVYQPKESYNYRYNRIYHAPVEITYRQLNYDDFDYFGDRVYVAQNLGGEVVDVPLAYQGVTGYKDDIVDYKEDIIGYNEIPIGIGEGDNKPIFDAYTHMPKLTPQDVSDPGVDRYEQLFDGDVNTKWCVVATSFNVKTAWVNFKADKLVSVKALNLTTGDDNNIYDGRNPKCFRLLGRALETDEWTTLLDVQNSGMGAYSCKTYTYDVSDHSFYQYFRLENLMSSSGYIGSEWDYLEIALGELSLTCRGKEDTEPMMTYEKEPIYGQVPVMGKVPVMEGEATYTFGYPVFSLERRYPIQISVVERYPWNGVQGSTLEDIVHVGGGKVTVHNGLKDGLQREEVELDSLGQGIYYLRAGQTTRLLTGEDALRTVTMTLEQDGTTYEAEPLRGYILNLFPTTGAKEILTQGNPLLIDILRDPPGGGSYATLSKGSKLKLSYTVDMKFQAGVNLTFTEGTALDTYTGTIDVTAEHGTINSASQTGIFALDVIFSGAGKKAYSYTMNVNEDITTSSASTLVGADADLYIGIVQNIIATQMSTIRAIPDAMYQQMLGRTSGSVGSVTSKFGSLVELAQGKDADGNLFHLVRDVSLAYGPEVTSHFVHSQKYITGELLPRLAQEIRDLLFTGTRDEAVALANKTQEPVYWSKVAADHENFGVEYEMISPDGKTGLRNEVDEKYSHMLAWIQMIGSNEQEKLAAYDLVSNYHVSFGSKVSYSESFESEFSQSQYINYPFTTADYFDTDGQGWEDRMAAAGGALLSQPGLKAALSALMKLINQRKFKNDQGQDETEARFSFFSHVFSFGVKPVAEYTSTATYGTQNNYSRKESFTIAMGGKSNLDVDVYRVRTMTTDTATVKGVGALDVYHNANFDNWVDVVRDHIKDGISYEGIDYSKAIYPRSFVYRTRGGATCNPWEDARYTVAFRPGTLLDERTKKICNPKITLDRQSVSGVAVGDPARFKIYMTNDSEQPEVVSGGLLTNSLQLDESTNPNGAKLYIDGTPLNAKGMDFFLKPGEIVEKTLEVYAGDEFDYEGLKLFLCSPDDWQHAYDEVSFDVHYLREAGPVNISTPGDKWVMNTNAQYNDKRGWFLPITIDGFNRHQKNFDHIEFQYKETQLGDNGWTNLCSFYADTLLMNQASGVRELIPENGNIVTQFYGEGPVIEKAYDLRAVLYCRDGNSFLTTSSKVLSGVKDTRRPQLFGTPEPKDGILNLGDNIIFNFTEDIEHNYLSAITNFEVKGEVNNTNVSEAVSVQFTGNGCVETEAQRNFSGKSFTVDLMIRPDATGRDMPLFSHGTNGKKLQLWLTSDYKLKAYVNNLFFESTEPIVKNAFTQVALTIDQENNMLTLYNGGKAIGSWGGIDATYGVRYDGTGPLIFGRTNETDRSKSQYYEGRMMEARLWYRALNGTQVGTAYGSRRLTGYEMGLVGYYPMNEGVGDVALDHTQGANARLINANWAMPQGWSLRLDKKDEGIQLDANALSRSADEDYTLMFWFKTGDRDCGLLGNGSGKAGFDGAENQFWLGIVDNELTYRSNGTTVTAGEGYADDQWHHFAMTVNRSRNVANIYVDQVLKATFATDALGGISGGTPLIGGGIVVDVVQPIVTGSIHEDSYTFTGNGSWADEDQTASVKNTVDLSTLTADYEAQDGDALTGTLGADVKISVADGATVTLSDATINGTYNYSCQWAGISCIGDATLVLKGTNTVKGFLGSYPGIHIPEGKTLTIQGSGSLTASSNGNGAGIGAGSQGYASPCGNILIKGGIITAIGGGYSAGIGGSGRANCGDITITGGTITATGGGYAPGIGAGYYETSCGDITIGDGVTSVTATCGEYTSYCIGISANTSSIGTVSIGTNDLGARFEGGMTGYVDELCMFQQALPLTLIKRYATKSPVGDEAGLMTYLGFDRQERQKDNDIEFVAYPYSKKLYIDNNGDIRYQLDPVTQEATSTPVRDYLFKDSVDVILPHIVQTTAAPVVPSENLTNLTFSFVGKDNQVLVNLKESASRLNRRNIYVTLRDVEDKNGNAMASPATACYYVSSSSLTWLENRVTRSVDYGQSEGIAFTVTNQSATKHTYTIENCPKWLALDSYSDVVDAQDRVVLTGTVNPALNVGSYDEIIYLTDEDGVSEPLYLSLTVVGEKPDWANEISSDLLQYSMNISARVVLLDEIDTDTRDIVGVFGRDGVCHGFANISYSALTGESNLYLTVYDNQASGRDLYFKLWQYTTGRQMVLNASPSIKFQSNAVLGSDEPVVLRGGYEYVQSFDLHKGWNWVSFNVASEKLFNLSNLLDGLPWKEGDVLTDMNSDATLIYRSGHWLASGSESVRILSQKNAYAIMVQEPVTFPIAGYIIKQLDMRTISLRPGWNGIGYTPMLNLPLETALADYYDKAQPGDVIKSHDEFAYFTVQGGVGRWRGSLEYMKPGEGYMLLRKADTETEFTYPYYDPTSTFIDEWSNATVRTAAPARLTTMTVTATVEGFDVEPGDRLLAFSNGEQLGEAPLAVEPRQPGLSGNSGQSGEASLFYLTLSAEAQADIWFAIERDGELVATTADNQMSYAPNAVIGSPDQPTAISFLQTDRAADGKWYTVGGILLHQRPTIPGVYIFNGKKVVIK